MPDSRSPEPQADALPAAPTQRTSAEQPRAQRSQRELSPDERRFLERVGGDRPPHHDSAWG